MKERPILFSGAMVEAILKGRKTQTRRVVKPPAPFDIGDDITVEWATGSIPCPYGVPGDRLWVRETWCNCWQNEHGVQSSVIYRADPHVSNVFGDAPGGYPWKPSIHMPRAYSRITLEITDVRVERIQDISEADAQAEGVMLPDCAYVGRCNSTRCQRHSADAHTSAFHILWDSINAERGYGWSVNPWVWVIGFKVVQR